MAKKPAPLCFIAILNGTLWLRGSASQVFQSAGNGRHGFGWSSKPPAGDARTAVPIDRALEAPLRAAIKARVQAVIDRQVAGWTPEYRARVGTWRPPADVAPHSSWIRCEDLPAALLATTLRAIDAHTAA